MIEFIKRRKLRKQIQRGQSSAVLAGSGFFWEFKPCLNDISHMDKLNPSDSQGHLPSCAAHALCNYLEWVIRTRNPDHGLKEGWQLNPLPVWQEALRLAGRQNTGLTAYELLAGAKSIALLPKEASMRPVFADQFFNKLVQEPLLTVVNITDNWPFADQRNGFIKPGGRPGEAHMVLACGVSAVAAPGGPFIHLLNSWGRKNGVDGIVTLNMAAFKKCVRETWELDFDRDFFAKYGHWRPLV